MNMKIKDELLQWFLKLKNYCIKS